MEVNLEFSECCRLADDHDATKLHTDTIAVDRLAAYSQALVHGIVSPAIPANVGFFKKIYMFILATSLDVSGGVQALE